MKSKKEIEASPYLKAKEHQDGPMRYWEKAHNSLSDIWFNLIQSGRDGEAAEIMEIVKTLNHWATKHGYSKKWLISFGVKVNK